MGSLLNRSSSQENMKVRREKRKRRHQHNRSFESDTFYTHDGNENEDPYGDDFINTYEIWDEEFDQQKLVNMNDPPGAPRTYPSKYSMTQNDILNQTWSSSHDVDNSFYTINLHRMTPSYNMPYITNQYDHDQIPNIINNQSKPIVTEERPSKRVQFATSKQQQQQTSALKPLVNTHSWHPSNDMSVPITTTKKPIPLSNKSSLPRPAASMVKISPTQIPVEKPIYVGIDYEATLAERSQTNTNKRHRKNVEKHHSDGLNSSSKNHRIRSHPTHPHKHQTSTDSPKININIISNNKSFDSFQPKSSPSHRTITKSIPTNKLTQNIEQIPSITNEIKPLKSRSNHQQQSSVNNEIKPSKTRENHRRHPPILSNESTLKTQSSTQRIENKQSSVPMMRVPLSQSNHKHQKQPIIQSIWTTTTSFTQTRM